MFCRNCGEVIIDTDVFCPNCGFAAGDGVKFCASCGSETPLGVTVCNVCGNSVNQLQPGAQPFMQNFQTQAAPPPAPQPFQQDPQIRDPYGVPQTQFRTVDPNMQPPQTMQQPNMYGQQPINGYVPPQTYYGAPGYQNVTYRSKTLAGLLGIFLGWLGVHNFYLGYTGKAVAQLLLGTLGACVGLGPIISFIWGLVEGIQILTGTINTDAKGLPLKD